MKKLLAFLTTLILVLSMAMPAYAAESWYGTNGNGTGDADTLQTITEQTKTLKELYEVDAVYLVDADLSGTDSAKNCLEANFDKLHVSDNYIVYCCTADDAYVRWEGACSSKMNSTVANQLFEDCEDYEEAGRYDLAASVFLADVTIEFAQGVPSVDGTLSSKTGSAGITVDANATYRQVVDEAGLLNDSEKTALENKLKEISERQQFDVVVVTTRDLQGKTAEAFADDFYDYNGYGYGASHDGCVLLMDMGNRYMHISTTGYGIKALTDEGIEYITDEIYTYAKKDDWAGSFNCYADKVDEFVTEAKTGKPYDVGHMPRHRKTAGEILKGLAISLVVGLIVAFILMKKVKGDYEKAVRYKANASDYLVSGSLQMTGAYDNFMYSNVTSRRIETESSSGGSSTHTGSSGTSHGGGGRSF